MSPSAGLLAFALAAGACISGTEDARTPEPTTTVRQILGRLVVVRGT